jgi:hypothetical protein
MNRASMKVFKKMAGDLVHYPLDWWEQKAERQNLLKNVVGEFDEDSEDDRGKPIFKKEKCVEFQNYLKSLEEEVAKSEKKR